jgi:NhaC family Na+:H+ antiporter
MSNNSENTKEPGVLLCLTPFIILIGLLVINILIYKDEATSGPNQLALMFSGGVATFIAVFVLKHPYKKIEDGIVHCLGLALQASLILLLVGSLIGLWIMSGVVPTMVFYGLKLINPTVFLPVACLVCSIVSLSSGSSWSTTGTVGVSLIAVGEALGIPQGMVAGAIISGAYFGDKMSPLSDTTNLAPAMAGTDLFTHIRHMMYTSVPAIVLALIGFTILGFFQGGTGGDLAQIDSVITTLESSFNITPVLFLVPIIVMAMVSKRVPAIPAIFIGVLLGAVGVVIFQQDMLHRVLGENYSFKAIYSEIVTVAASGFKATTGNEMLDSLISRGGMSSMLSTIWLITCAMTLGGAMDASGMLDKIANSILKSVTTAGGLVGATLASCFFLNMTASDQYIAIVVPGRMFKKMYEKFNLHPKNLSRALEDSGTVTSVLIPWNSGGAYNSGVLGVATLTYLPYCFFNILSPIISLFLATVGWTIEKQIQEQKA